MPLVEGAIGARGDDDDWTVVLLLSCLGTLYTGLMYPAGGSERLRSVSNPPGPMLLRQSQYKYSLSRLQQGTNKP